MCGAMLPRNFVMIRQRKPEQCPSEVAAGIDHHLQCFCHKPKKMTVNQNTLYSKLNGRILMKLSVGIEEGRNYTATKFCDDQTKETRAMPFGSGDWDRRLQYFCPGTKKDSSVVYQNTLYSKLNGCILMKISVGMKKVWNYAAMKRCNDQTKETKVMSFGTWERDSLLLQCFCHESRQYTKTHFTASSMVGFC